MFKESAMCLKLTHILTSIYKMLYIKKCFNIRNQINIFFLILGWNIKTRTFHCYSKANPEPIWVGILSHNLPFSRETIPCPVGQASWTQTPFSPKRGRNPTVAVPPGQWSGPKSFFCSLLELFLTLDLTRSLSGGHHWHTLISQS